MTPEHECCICKRVKGSYWTGKCCYCDMQWNTCAYTGVPLLSELEPMLGCGEHVCVESRHHVQTAGAWDWESDHRCKCGATHYVQRHENGPESLDQTAQEKRIAELTNLLHDDEECGKLLDAKDAELERLTARLAVLDLERQGDEARIKELSERLERLRTALQRVARLCHAAAFQHKCESCKGHALIAEDALTHE